MAVMTGATTSTAGGWPGGRRLAADIVGPERWDDIVDWDEAVAAMANPSVFLTRAWMQAWWRHVGAASRTAVLVRVVDERGRTAGLAPFTIDRCGPAGRIRRLSFLADSLVGSEYLGLVARAGMEQQVVSAALGCIEAAGIDWHVARLPGLRPGDPAASALQAALIAGGGRHDAREEPCAAIVLPEDPEAWLAGLSGSFRRRLRQRRRRLERDHDVAYRLADDTDQVRLGLDRLFAMHLDRWESRGRPGSFADPRMRAFYQELAPAFLESGWLRLWVLEVDGVSRAVQFGFAHEGVLHSLQEAYDSAWNEPGVSGLGVVLRLHAVEAAIAEGLAAYDFLGGDQDYKRRWGTTGAAVSEARIARRGIGGRSAWTTTFGVGDTRDRVARRVPVRMKLRLRALSPGR